MIEDIDTLQNTHIEASTMLMEHLMEQFKDTRQQTLSAVSEALKINFKNPVSLDFMLMPAKKEEMHEAVLKACLAGTLNYFLIEGVSPQAKKSLLKGFLPSFNLFDLLGDTNIHHDWFLDEAFIKQHYYQPKKMEEALGELALPKHVSQLPTFSQQTDDKRVQFGRENHGQDEDMGDGTGRQKDNVLRKIVSHVYRYSELDHVSMEQELVRLIQAKTSKLALVLDGVAGSLTSQNLHLVFEDTKQEPPSLVSISGVKDKRQEKAEPASLINRATHPL